MTVLRLGGFGGENRALHPMLLPEMVGVTSINQKPGRGDLRPWLAPATVSSVTAGSVTIHRMGRAVASDVNYWLRWPQLVHCVVAPNADDTHERTLYSGAGTPKWTNTVLALASAPYPAAYRELGVPAPLVPLSLVASTTATLSAGSFVVGTTYTIVAAGNTDWVAIGATATTVAAGSFVIGTSYTIKTVGGTDYTLIGASASTVGVTFTATGKGTGSGTATQIIMAGVVFTATGVGSGTGTARRTNTISETRSYTYTCVNDIGEESAPYSPPVEIECKTLDTIAISNMSTPSGAYAITAYRVYRTQTSSTGGDFYFLLETSLSSASDTGQTLSEVMPSKTWTMPPTDLSWMTGLWNGMVAGISGRSVRFCEAYKFHAWPIGYEILPTNVQPVALATFGQTLVMLTNGNPSTITGGTPDAMDEMPAEFCQACVAPLSAVGMGHGVAWASPDGLAYIGSGGARLLTEGFMTREDWQALNPTSIKATMFERRYLATYTVGGVQKGFIVDPANPQGMYFLDFGFDGLYLDDLQDALYVLAGTAVQKWDSGAAKTVTFKSKLFKTPKPTIAFGCAEVVADAYPVTFKLYVDGALKYTKTVTSAEPFRLPSGYHAMTFQMEVSSTGALQGVAMAHTMTELAQT